MKAKKLRREGEEEEEYRKVDDEDKDPDYRPEKDPEQDFIVENAELDEEETFEIEKTCACHKSTRSWQLHGRNQAFCGMLWEGGTQGKKRCC